jgi:hypothetical protein
LAKFSVTTTWIGLAAVATAGMVIGLIGQIAGVPESIMFAVFLVTGVLYYAMIMRTWRVLRFFKRSINRRQAQKIDRRSGTERRQKNVGYYVDGVLTERRSGLDRRRHDGDRRDEIGQVSPKLMDLSANDPSIRTDRAARVSSGSSAQ